MEILEARKLVCESGRRMLKEGLVTGTWGNVSCRVDGRRMVITPSAADYKASGPEDMVLMDFCTGEVLEEKKPSTEYALHAQIYREKQNLGAVVHCHSRYACIAAVTAGKLPPYLEDMAMLLGPGVKVAPYAPAGSPELAEKAVEALGDNYAVLLQNHGAVCVGRDMEEAFSACRMLEKACQVFITAQLLGGGKPLTEEDAAALRKKYLEVYKKK
ncbi:MAG: class II aldolase/adducin family protein [Bacillota bacterium]|nr:class II aldolase/adducin family protein [Bacillota bacterium]